jgi:membrane-associated protease RseP (regulator of RpoE activity)
MSTKLRDVSEWLLMVAMIFGGGAIAQAQNDAATGEQPPGKIVRIGPGDSEISIDGATVEEEAGDASVEPQAPKQWIGIFLAPVSDELRAQLDIPVDQGVLARHIVPGSPAQKAGLKPYDILLAANGEKLSDAGQLTDLVRGQGDKGAEIKLDVLRRGEHLSIVLTPEARPDVSSLGGRGMPPMGRGTQAWHLNPRDPMSFGFRGMPGARPMPGFNLNQMPSGVSVSIQKQNDGPAHITVKRGNDTWDIVGDDPNSLAALPEDLRPFVEQMLAGAQSAQMPSMPQMNQMPQMPQMNQMPMMPGMGPPAGFRDGELQQRLDQMQQQLEELQQKMRDQVEAMETEDAAAVDSQ